MEHAIKVGQKVRIKDFTGTHEFNAEGKRVPATYEGTVKAVWGEEKTFCRVFVPRLVKICLRLGENHGGYVIREPHELEEVE